MMASIGRNVRFLWFGAREVVLETGAKRFISVVRLGLLIYLLFAITLLVLRV